MTLLLDSRPNHHNNLKVLAPPKRKPLNPTVRVQGFSLRMKKKEKGLHGRVPCNKAYVHKKSVLHTIKDKAIRGLWKKSFCV